jgi:hypothetical protein
MLISPGLLESVSAVDILHTNADYPDAWGTDLSPERIAYKSTDHDIPLLVLQLGTETDEVVPTATPSAAVTVAAQPDEVAEVTEVADSAETATTAAIAGIILVSVFGLGGFLFWRNRRSA